MSLWKTIKQELDGPLDMVRKGLSDAIDLAEDLSRKGRIKLEIHTMKSEIKSQMAELGGRVHQLAVEEGATDILGDDVVKGILDRISELAQKIRMKEDELRAEEGARAESKAS